MAVRVLLVALVAVLGLDLPGPGQLEGWREAGREWASTRMADLSRLRVEVERAMDGSGDGPAVDPVAAVEAAPSGRVDLAFEAAVEGMASNFSADLASNVEGAKPPVEAAVAAVEAPREMPPSEPVAIEPGPDAEAPASRLDRISTAVRLTRQAVDAWASLIRPSDNPPAADGQGDAF